MVEGSKGTAWGPQGSQGDRIAAVNPGGPTDDAYSKQCIRPLCTDLLWSSKWGALGENTNIHLGIKVKYFATAFLVFRLTSTMYQVHRYLGARCASW